MWITVKKQDKLTTKSQEKFPPKLLPENMSLAVMWGIIVTKPSVS